MKYSSYQEDFFQAIKKTKDNIILKAVPGAGKTTSIVEALKFIPKYKKSIFLAFSKQIQLELDKRVPEHIENSTLHSLGLRIIREHFRTRIKVDDYKSFKFSEDIVAEMKNKEGKDLSKKEKFIYQYTLSDLINLSRITMNTSLEGFKNVEKNYGIICSNGEVENAFGIFNKMQEYTSRRRKLLSVDFVDMIFQPAFQDNIEIPKYDYVITDESQDFNATQHRLISKLLKPNGRLIAVGDPMQSIYGFQGAMSDSMNRLKNNFNMCEYPLSISYRVPKAGIKLLKELNPEIESYDDAPEGIVRKGDLNQIREGDLVISRNTKPLITAYFRLLRQEKKATIIGKEMERGLNNILIKLEGKSIDEADLFLEKEKENIENQLTEKGIENPKKHYKYQMYTEKVEILRIFFSNYQSINEIKNRVKDIFDENKSGIKLMTIHKSKGLESERVFFITHFEGEKLIPSKYAMTKEQLKQESNLEYVALSRFKKELILISM